MLNLKKLIKEIARETSREVLREEMPKILDNMSKPGKLLSELVGYDQASEMLGVTKTTLHNYINQGRLTKHYAVEGGKPFLKLSEIESMIKKSRRVKASIN